jgi:peptidoglycan hydrolase CwlO-like protein
MPIDPNVIEKQIEALEEEIRTLVERVKLKKKIARKLRAAQELGNPI